MAIPRPARACTPILVAHYGLNPCYATQGRHPHASPAVLKARSANSSEDGSALKAADAAGKKRPRVVASGKFEPSLETSRDVSTEESGTTIGPTAAMLATMPSAWEELITQLQSARADCETLRADNAALRTQAAVRFVPAPAGSPSSAAESPSSAQQPAAILNAVAELRAVVESALPRWGMADDVLHASERAAASASAAAAAADTAATAAQSAAAATTAAASRASPAGQVAEFNPPELRELRDRLEDTRAQLDEYKQYTAELRQALQDLLEENKQLAARSEQCDKVEQQLREAKSTIAYLSTLVQVCGRARARAHARTLSWRCGLCAYHCTMRPARSCSPLTGTRSP